MPRPVNSDRYMPGLDGVRALAVMVVVGYHTGLPIMEGGLLGVGVFFTLSGFLITSLLLQTWERRGDLNLKEFWTRRARRLLPALFIVLAAVMAVSAIVQATSLAVRGQEALGALLYVSNWQQVAGEISYFDRVGGPGPLDHLWSLAVEEQFYLLWPLMLLGLLALFRGRIRWVAAATLAMAAGSFVLLALIAEPGFDNTRAYVGTDTRAGGLLLGAVVAMFWRPGHLPRALSRSRRIGMDAVAVVSLAAILGLVVSTTSYSLSLYSSGLLLLTVATAALVAVVVHPESRVGAALGVTPMRWIGERSYGIYLWHLPVVFFTPIALLPENPAVVAALQVTLTVLLATVSWNRVENPIRTLGFKTAFGLDRARTPMLRPHTSAVGGSVVAVGMATVMLAGTAAFAANNYQVDPEDPLLVTAVAPAAEPVTEPERTPALAPIPSAPTTPTAAQKPATSPVAASAAATWCTQVRHVGDSTSLGFILKSYQPDASKMIPAMYTAIGVDKAVADVDGARSIVERYKDRPNAEESVAAAVAAGYQGCWVMALGINEGANVAVGGDVGFAERIDRMMAAVGNQSTLWTTVKTIKKTGPYADKNMTGWNEALLAACERYPNMRVFDWRAEVRNEWYIYDEIHYSTDGYAERADRMAAALAKAYPAGGSSPSGCLVSSGR